MVEIDKGQQNRFRGYGMDDYQPHLVTNGYPRPAKDDAIWFRGIDALVYAPAGKGQLVYDAIMSEIARGYEHETPSP
jgi:hypothetical protein